MWQGHFQISTTADVLHHGGLYQCTRQAVTNVYAEVAKTYRKPNATRFRRSAPPAPPACGWRVRRRRGRVGGEIWDWRIADAAMAAGLEPSSPRLARFGWGRRRRRCATSRRCGFVFWAHIHGEVGLAHREHASLARFGPITKVRWAWPIMNTRALRVGPGTCAAQPVAARLTWSPLAAGAERLSDNPNDIDGGGGGANRASARGGRTAPLAAWEVCLPPTLRRSRRRRGVPGAAGGEAGAVHEARVLRLRRPQGEAPGRLPARRHTLLARLPRAPGKQTRPRSWLLRSLSLGGFHPEKLGFVFRSGEGHHDESGLGADVPVRDPGARQGSSRRQRGVVSSSQSRSLLAFSLGVLSLEFVSS